VNDHLGRKSRARSTKRLIDSKVAESRRTTIARWRSMYHQVVIAIVGDAVVAQAGIDGRAHAHT